MPMVERFTEVQIVLPASTVPQRACRFDINRVYLGLFRSGTATSFIMTTKAGLNSASGALAGISNPGQNGTELFKDRHGFLTCQEWFVGDPAGLGGATITVFEVIREDTGPARRNEGIILPGSVDYVGLTDYTPLDRAEVLSRAIERATKGWKNGSAAH